MGSRGLRFRETLAPIVLGHHPCFLYFFSVFSVRLNSFLFCYSSFQFCLAFEFFKVGHFLAPNLKLFFSSFPESRGTDSSGEDDSDEDEQNGNANDEVNSSLPKVLETLLPPPRPDRGRPLSAHVLDATVTNLRSQIFLRSRSKIC